MVSLFIERVLEVFFTSWRAQRLVDLEADRYISMERIFEESKESYHETSEESSFGWHEGPRPR
jgi:hypothetical protein